MDVRAHMAMVFHLDKCIGCHTCSIACKNIWTDREGTEYQWWNNVETKPGTGYPAKWEDQERFQGGWMKTKDGKLKLRSTSKRRIIGNIFHHPHMPTIDDYYEPWTYDYQNLFNAPEGDDQPTAIPISKITGEYIDIESGPNWDDDLSGSPVYAENDPNHAALTAEQKAQMFAVERLVFFYFPRICNHCLNPACVASCPSGALYKRGEDGIVLVNQNRCRAWRACIAACPYKKVYFNWSTGKSEKCILCFPRLETGEAPACFHSCVGRIRYLGVMLYDAERIEEIAHADQENLIEKQRSMFLDPHDPKVIDAALENGITPDVLDAAQKSPSYKFIVDWKLALPPHAEYRTLPMLWYVPPLSPVTAEKGDDIVRLNSDDLFGTIEQARVPVEYLASLLGAGNASGVRYALKKMLAVRWHRRQVTVGDVDAEAVKRALSEADTTPEQADEIFRLTALPLFDERFVIPPGRREQAIEAFSEATTSDMHKRATGFGFRTAPKRGV